MRLLAICFPLLLALKPTECNIAVDSLLSSLPPAASRLPSLPTFPKQAPQAIGSLSRQRPKQLGEAAKKAALAARSGKQLFGQAAQRGSLRINGAAQVAAAKAVSSPAGVGASKLASKGKEAVQRAAMSATALAQKTPVSLLPKSRRLNEWGKLAKPHGLRGNFPPQALQTVIPGTIGGLTGLGSVLPVRDIGRLFSRRLTEVEPVLEGAPAYTQHTPAAAIVDHPIAPSSEEVIPGAQQGEEEAGCTFPCIRNWPRRIEGSIPFHPFSPPVPTPLPEEEVPCTFPCIRDFAKKVKANPLPTVVPGTRTWTLVPQIFPWTVTGSQR